MNHGDVVIPVGDKTLECNGRRHICAIVCWLEPLILVSVDATAVWEKEVSPEQFQALCRADADLIYGAMRRLPQELQDRHKASQPRSAAEIYAAMEEHSDKAMLATLSHISIDPAEEAFYDRLRQRSEDSDHNRSTHERM